MDRGAWQAPVHGVTKSQALLSGFHFHIRKAWKPNEEFQKNLIEVHIIWDLHTLIGIENKILFLNAMAIIFFKF